MRWEPAQVTLSVGLPTFCTVVGPTHLHILLCRCLDVVKPQELQLCTAAHNCNPHHAPELTPHDCRNPTFAIKIAQQRDSYSINTGCCHACKDVDLLIKVLSNVWAASKKQVQNKMRYEYTCVIYQSKAKIVLFLSIDSKTFIRHLVQKIHMIVTLGPGHNWLKGVVPVRWLLACLLALPYTPPKLGCKATPERLYLWS